MNTLGWVEVRPDSEDFERAGHVLELDTDAWAGWLRSSFCLRALREERELCVTFLQKHLAQHPAR